MNKNRQLTNRAKAEYIVELRQILVDKLTFYWKKERAARSDEKQDYWRDKANKLNKNLWRSFGLADRILNPRKLGENGVLWQGWAADNWKKYEALRKQKGLEKFLNTHYYAAWFMSNSLRADYGQYVCDRCGEIFYHSPSTITKAAKEVYHCCCGYCTNAIIKCDHGHKPFE